MNIHRVGLKKAFLPSQRHNPYGVDVSSRFQGVTNVPCDGTPGTNREDVTTPMAHVTNVTGKNSQQT